MLVLDLANQGCKEKGGRVAPQARNSISSTSSTCAWSPRICLTNTIAALQRCKNSIRRYQIVFLCSCPSNSTWSAGSTIVSNWRRKTWNPIFVFLFPCLIYQLCWSKNVKQGWEGCTRSIPHGCNGATVLCTTLTWQSTWRQKECCSNHGSSLENDWVFPLAWKPPIILAPNAKNKAYRILHDEVWSGSEFNKLSIIGLIGTHSLRKYPSTHAWRNKWMLLWWYRFPQLLEMAHKASRLLHWCWSPSISWCQGGSSPACVLEEHVSMCSKRVAVWLMIGFWKLLLQIFSCSSHVK